MSIQHETLLYPHHTETEVRIELDLKRKCEVLFERISVQIHGMIEGDSTEHEYLNDVCGGTRYPV